MNQRPKLAAVLIGMVDGQVLASPRPVVGNGDDDQDNDVPAPGASSTSYATLRDGSEACRRSAPPSLRRQQGVLRTMQPTS
jgi:hypothetical protein